MVIIYLAAEEVGETFLGLVGKLGEGATAEVEVDTDDATVADGEAGTEVGGDEGLTGTGIEGGEHDDSPLKPPSSSPRGEIIGYR